MDSPSAPFVPAPTPLPPQNVQDSSLGSNATTSQDIGLTTQIDVLDTAPQIELKLLAKQLLFYACTTVLFYGAFTIVAYIGFAVETIYEPIGTSKKAEDRVEIYNTYSGYLMAFLETILDMYMDKFVPVLNVYVHNTLYFLQKATATKDPRTGKFKPSVRFSRRTHEFILFFFPIALALTLGNSIRGLQAAQSSDGFKHIMIVDDLKKEQPTLELIKAAMGKKTALSANQDNARIKSEDTILKNAIRGQSTPFSFDTKSPCGMSAFSSNDSDSLEDEILNSNKNERTLQLNVHDLDTTSAVYGFIPQEWNNEAFTTALEPTSTFHITYQEATAADAANKTLPLPPNFSLRVAYEMLVQGKLLIERAQGDAATEMYPCSLTDGRTEDDVLVNTTTSGTSTTPVNATRQPPTSTTKSSVASSRPSVSKKLAMGLFSERRLQDTQEDSSNVDDEDDDDIDDSLNQWTRDAKGVRQCQGAVSSLFDMFDFYDVDAQTTMDLMLNTGDIFNKTLGNLSIEETEITLQTYTLTEQIHIETMRIDIPISTDVGYGLEQGCDNETTTGCSDYTYDFLAETFCGSNGCAFVDSSGTMEMQRQIGIVPYVTNCSMDYQSVHYSADFRGYFPDNCTKVSNAAFLYGIGSYITGDEYGSNDTTHKTYAPYLIAPRRHLRFTFAKVTWQTEDLAKKFNAKCGNGNGNTDCNGLWYQLKPSNRFLFAGIDALPTKKLAAADFRSPIPLVQLNAPTLYVEKVDGRITLEPLVPTNFKRVKWDKQAITLKTSNGTSVTTQAALYDDQCSMLIDSYLRQVSDNNYMLEQPLQVMYTSFFYYWMQNAAVTELNDTKLALNGTLDLNQTSISLAKSKDKLGNVKLKGDLQIRSIRVSIPTASFQTTFAGCILIFVVMLIILFVPVRRVEYFEEDASMARKFVAMRSDKAYPDGVHTKTLFFPVTKETVPFDEVEVEAMVLMHETDRHKKIYM